MLKKNELPIDADGVVFMPGDSVWKGGREATVQEVALNQHGWVIKVRWEDNSCDTVESPIFLTHKNPDFWDAIEREVYHLVMSEYLDDPKGDVKRVVEQIKETVGA